ncbi:hypothetical protein [Turicibacter sanguinis]|uniref:hypothetical protein n=1 Tax=Turicibacter sanguinis TaxID=154288 RepID=UPI00189983D9|nr:hypothetical protein [Turicibacter sanguinis]
MKRSNLSVVFLCGALLVGCNQGNSLQDQVENLPITDAYIPETVKEYRDYEEFYSAVDVLTTVELVNYEERVIVLKDYGSYIINEEDKQYEHFGYSMESVLMEYDFAMTILDNHEVKDVTVIVIIENYDGEVIGYYDGTTWEEAK